MGKRKRGEERRQKRLVAHHCNFYILARIRYRRLIQRQSSPSKGRVQPRLPLCGHIETIPSPRRIQQKRYTDNLFSHIYIYCTYRGTCTGTSTTKQKPAAAAESETGKRMSMKNDGYVCASHREVYIEGREVYGNGEKQKE